MELVGLNTGYLKDEGQTDNVQIYHGEELLSRCAIPKSWETRSEILSEIAKLDILYQKVARKCADNPPQTQNLDIINNQVWLRKGLAVHNMSFNDTEENIYERLLSISENGLLPIEWFGIWYPENEVKYMVSAHRVRNDCLFSEMELKKDPLSSDSKVLKIAPFNLIIDFENPALEPLKDFANNNSAFVRQFFGRTNDNELILSQQTEELVEKSLNETIKDLKKIISQYGDTIKEFIDIYGKDYTEENLKEFCKKKYLIIFKSLGQFISNFGTDFSEINLQKFKESLKEEKLQNYLQQKRRCLAAYKEHHYYLYGGIPAQLIIGISLPNHLAKNNDFVEKIQDIFPHTTIFDEQGYVISLTKETTQQI